MSVKALPEAIAFDEEGIKKLKSKVVASLPKDSEQVEITSIEMDSVVINGNHTCEITVSFLLFAQRFRMSALIAQIGKQEFIAETSAHPADFDKVHSIFRASLCSLQWL